LSPDDTLKEKSSEKTGETPRNKTSGMMAESPACASRRDQVREKEKKNSWKRKNTWKKGG